MALLAEWHNYAEFDLWKMAQRKNSTGKHARVSAAPFLVPIRGSNRFAGPFITAIKARLKLKHG